MCLACSPTIDSSDLSLKDMTEGLHVRSQRKTELTVTGCRGRTITLVMPHCTCVSNTSADYLAVKLVAFLFFDDIHQKFISTVCRERKRGFLAAASERKARRHIIRRRGSKRVSKWGKIPVVSRMPLEHHEDNNNNSVALR